MRPVGHVRVDFHAAIHRARVQDEDIARRLFEPRTGDAVHAIVFAQRRDVASLHALELQSQDVEGIGPLDRFLDAIKHGHAHLADGVGEQ